MKSKVSLREEFRLRLSSSKTRGPQKNAPGEILVVDPDLASRITKLNQALFDFFADHDAKPTWAAFQPVGFEADIREFLARTTDQIDWVFPRVTGQGLIFFRPRDLNSFSLNKWGIAEPDPARSQAVALRELRGLLVPGLAFDSQLNRLGRGGGYYDRTLAECLSINPHAMKIGVAFDLQISAEPFPTESFDIPMDLVITESRTLELPRADGISLNVHSPCKRKSS